ncbi:MAG: urease accessory protein UreE [Pseudomonadota bacterium]
MMPTLLLDYEARYFRRRSFEADGQRFDIDLPKPRAFQDGETVEAIDGTQLTIRAAGEPLMEVRSKNLTRLAWHIGNRHTPCQVEVDRLLIQRDHVLEDMLAKLGATVRHITEPFQPEGGAYGHGRTHGHSHSHDAHADPNAHIPNRHGQHHQHTRD